MSLNELRDEIHNRDNIQETVASEYRILDACCGSKMMWFDKNRSDTVYMDNRIYDTVLCDGRQLHVRPDIVADFRDIPFRDNTFYMVVFDPPHLVRAGEDSWLRHKYGVLSSTWRQDIKAGFDECIRVLKPNGTLVFKWNEDQIQLRDIVATIGRKPLFGNKRSKTHWLVYMKENKI